MVLQQSCIYVYEESAEVKTQIFLIG